MEIKRYSPLDQVDPAVALGVVAKALPDVLTFGQIRTANYPKRTVIVEGLLHQGCKMILGGTSKSNKSWSLLDLGMAVATGQPWWGLDTKPLPVMYLNFELQPDFLRERLLNILGARPALPLDLLESNFHSWNLRGYNADLTLLRPQLEAELTKKNYGLIILDPAYKLLGERDENANGEIAGLMNEFEALAASTGAAIVLAHHFAKGDSTAKSAIDRMSGAGAWARDPDAILVLTPHEEDDHFTCSTILRNFPRMDDFVMRWDWPLMHRAEGLNPDALRRIGGKAKVCTDADFVGLLEVEPMPPSAIVAKAQHCLEMSKTTCLRYLNRLAKAGMIGHHAGVYWRKQTT